MLEEINKAGKAARLRGFERISGVWLDATPFSVETDTMTPSFKLKRPQLQKKYQVRACSLLHMAACTWLAACNFSSTYARDESQLICHRCCAEGHRFHV